MIKNRVKEKLRAGQSSLGTWIGIGHQEVAEILSQIGFDWLIFDTEHAPLSIETVQSLIQTLGGSSVVPLVRVAWNDPVLIKRALDIGAYGVLIPWVNNRKEAMRAVSACKYPPLGIRGCGPRRVSRYGLALAEYLASANEEILVAIQIETEESLENLDEILPVEGVDVVFIGPVDLSVSLGIFKQWENPRFKRAIEKVLAACRKYRVTPGIYSLDVEDAKARLNQGFRFVGILSDTDFLISGSREALKRVLGKG